MSTTDAGERAAQSARDGGVPDYLKGFAPDHAAWVQRQVAAAPPMSEKLREQVAELLAAQALQQAARDTDAA